MAISEDRARALVEWLTDEAADGCHPVAPYANYYRYARHAVLAQMGVPQDMGIFVEAEAREAMAYFNRNYMAGDD